jgi:hypothetical protein
MAKNKHKSENVSLSPATKADVLRDEAAEDSKHLSTSYLQAKRDGLIGAVESEQEEMQRLLAIIEEAQKRVEHLNAVIAGIETVIASRG